MVSRCIAVKKNLRARLIRGDTLCARCGAPEESINHAFFNVHRRFKCGLSQGSHQIKIFSPFSHFSQTLIIYFGEFPQIWRTTNLRGFYDTYGKEETIKLLAIWMLMQETLSN